MFDFIVKPYGKRFFLSVLFIVALSALFWTQSRYTSLDEKSLMSGAIQLEDPLSFEALFPISADMPVVKRIALSTLNWLYTNRTGMIFGVSFGAALLTLFGYIQRHSFKNSFLNSALGLFIGAPLGVCVNCAAPIGRALYSSGARAETALSTMIASPTLNIVVLTMLFSILPVYMAVTKILLSLIIILVAVPVICRFLPGSQLEISPGSETGIAPNYWPSFEKDENIATAVIAFARTYVTNLWFIIKMTVPLMFLAGLLGAIAATLLPPDLLIGAAFSIVIVSIVAIIGTFLPVPIAFDVVVAGAFLSSGLAPGYVMTLLFTLGIFSVYSFFIVAGSISRRAAVLIGAVVVIFGILAGTAVQTYHNWQTKRALEILLGFEQSLFGPAHAQEALGTLTITRTPYNPRSFAADKPFSRIEAWHLGIDKPIEFSFQDMWPPFWEGRSLSSGDIDKDGDIDLVIASTFVGLYVYHNDGTGQFAAQPVELGKLADLDIFNAALVDIDNDGWLDLFLATYQTGNFVLPNDSGTFDPAGLYQSANRDDAMLSMALSFGDIDRDGDLDLALGNWAAGWYRRVPGEESRNRIVFNNGDRLDGGDFVELPGLPGETLSILISDINGDQAADLLVGNDFELPDVIYLGKPAGGLRKVQNADGLLPYTTTTTMAVKTADLHNDGTPEIYFAQIAGRSSGVSETLKMQSLDVYCANIERQQDRSVCEKNMEIKTWYQSGNNFDPAYAPKCAELSGNYQSECKAMLVKDLAIQQNDVAICNLIPHSQSQPKALCNIHFRAIRKSTKAERQTNLPQILRSNVLLERQEDQGFADKAEAQGLDVGGWSWDTKIADFDNDGFQDVYIVNGTWVPNEVSPSNLFFHNTGDGGFTEQSGPFGLEDYLMTAAATAFDMDFDGDLDLISHPVNGPITVFRNNSQTGNAISFKFRDALGNHFGIGTKVVIRFGDDQMQSRELQTGGGFMSFDAPVAHFGLGDQPQVKDVVIYWADGGQSRIDGPLAANFAYTVSRR